MISGKGPGGLPRSRRPEAPFDCGPFEDAPGVTHGREDRRSPKSGATLRSCYVAKLLRRVAKYRGLFPAFVAVDYYGGVGRYEAREQMSLGETPNTAIANWGIAN